MNPSKLEVEMKCDNEFKTSSQNDEESSLDDDNINSPVII